MAMTAPQFKYIYGPVYSWRLGMSLGLDPLGTDQKYCNFECSYCQLGVAAKLFSERKVFVPVGNIINELKLLPAGTAIDYVTFSGNGEPTLAANLGDMLKAVRSEFSYRTAVITNSSIICLPEVQSDLAQADFILFKLDAHDQATFERINHPAAGIRLQDIISGIKNFQKTFVGRLALQIMFTGANQDQAAGLARLAREIAPDEVQLNTPLRPSPARPISQSEMLEVKKYFTGMNVLSVYEEEKKAYQPFDEQATTKRHGRYQ